MAAAAHVTINLYGLVEGQVPFQNASGQTAFSREKIFPKSGAVSLPTAGVVYHPLQNGFLVKNNTGSFYMYSVIEVLPSGLNVHGDKYLTDEGVASLATDAG